MFNDKNAKGRFEACRLETPSMSGFRSGMSSSRLIAGRLGRLYHPPAEMPSEMDTLIRAIDAKTSPSS